MLHGCVCACRVYVHVCVRVRVQAVCRSSCFTQPCFAQPCLSACRLPSRGRLQAPTPPCPMCGAPWTGTLSSLRTRSLCNRQALSHYVPSFQSTRQHQSFMRVPLLCSPMLSGRGAGVPLSSPSPPTSPFPPPPPPPPPSPPPPPPPPPP